MNAEQKQRAEQIVSQWGHTSAGTMGHAWAGRSAVALLQELIDEPVAWAYSDNFGTHVTSDKSEFWGVPGIESFTELYTSPPAPSVPDADLVRDAERLRTAHRLLTMNAIGYDEWIAAVDKMTAIERDKKGGAA